MLHYLFSFICRLLAKQQKRDEWTEEDQKNLEQSTIVGREGMVFFSIVDQENQA